MQPKRYRHVLVDFGGGSLRGHAGAALRLATTLVAAGAMTSAAQAAWVTVGRSCEDNAAGTLCVERQVDADDDRMRGRWTAQVADGEWIQPMRGYLAFTPRRGTVLGPCGRTMAGTVLSCARQTSSEAGGWHEHDGAREGVYGFTAESSHGTLRVAAGDTGWHPVAKPRCTAIDAGTVCLNMGERFVGLRLLRRMDAATRPARGNWIQPRAMTLMVRQNSEGSRWESRRRELCAARACWSEERRSQDWHGVVIRGTQDPSGATVRRGSFSFATADGVDWVEMTDR